MEAGQRVSQYSDCQCRTGEVTISLAAAGVMASGYCTRDAREVILQLGRR
jgi:hypothetical protein